MQFEVGDTIRRTPKFVDGLGELGLAYKFTELGVVTSVTDRYPIRVKWEQTLPQEQCYDEEDLILVKRPINKIHYRLTLDLHLPPAGGTCLE